VPPPRTTRFGSPLVLSRVHWLRPELVAEVSFGGQQLLEPNLSSSSAPDDERTLALAALPSVLGRLGWDFIAARACVFR
jgi:hypothetical protein